MSGLSRHEKNGNGENVWLTPPELVKALGPFDLDPCYSEPRPWQTAKRHYGPDAAGGLGGLFAEWEGLVWCNPPYGDKSAEWLEKCANHGDAIALIFARTETNTFFEYVWRRASAVLFLRGRLTFRLPKGRMAKGNSGAPSVLVAYGSLATERLKTAGLVGQYLDLNNGEGRP